VPEIAAARDLRMVVQSLNLNKSTTDPTLYEYEPVAYVAAPEGYSLGTDFSLYTVNGQGVSFAENNSGTYTPLALPVFAMQPGEVVRLRILNGTNAFHLPLVLPGCDLFVIAYDGVNLLAPVEVAQDGTTLITPSNMLSNQSILIEPGMRVELLVRAPQTPGPYKLSALATDGVNFQPYPQLDLAEFIVSGAAVTMNIPTSLPTPTREYPAIADSEIVNRRTITFSNGPAPTLLTGVGFLIDDVLYDTMTVNYSATIGTSEEWTIENSTGESHPFHLHENSFEVIAYNGVTVPTTIRDTVVIPPAEGANGSVTIRIRFKGDTGKTVFHCHILPHEDTGMMQNLMMV
jgi:FtsP/CotA-like multicopper oxidase with cupredoxin domain